MNNKKFEVMEMSEVKRNFFKKSREEEMYRKFRKMLIKKGYKPLNNITYTYSFDCKQTKRSNKSPNQHKYPYSIVIKYQIPAVHYKSAA